MTSKTARPQSAPLTVVVTPVYNGEAFLRAAMESVQAQTYPNLLHLVLDNASTDRTADILGSYVDRAVPVIVYRNPDLLPLTDNWDKAFSLIPEEAVYAKLLCADDIMHPDCIARFVGLAEAHPSVQTVSCEDVHCDLVRRANIPAGQTIVDGVAASRAILDRTISWLPFQHLFVRLHPADRARPFFGTHEYGADPYAVVRAALRGDFGYLHEPLVYSRRHAGAASNSLMTDGRSPLYARQINMMLLTYFKMMLVFGERCWTERGYARAVTFARRNMARKALLWRLRRFGMAYRELTSELARIGAPLRGADYCVAVLAWPAYAIWKLGWRTPIGPQLSEAAFLVL
ncbi:glycosyltransferase [uncultured Sphingomonas sp.]|mgnify:CR=1 FL=1|uniref:glycosyltransferase n=1 Tax=uncultured Sphingomonas sp. TaxID=158754 RepID=UPI0025FCA55C|nr:glycosyltransferase [uncultured Sphingomonas sp.]